MLPYINWDILEKVRIYHLVVSVFLSNSRTYLTTQVCHTHNGDQLQPALISKVDCVGVERRLIDCPIKHALSNSTCSDPVEISVNNGKNLFMV